MRNLIVKTFILQLGFLGIGATAMADHQLRCEAIFKQPGKVRVTKVYDVERDQGHILVSEDIALIGEVSVNLHIYFDGTYSSINIFHEPSKTYLNADNDHGSAKFFSLSFSSGNHPIFEEAHAHCLVKDHPKEGGN